MEGIGEIHYALIHHRDIYPRDILLVPGDPERVVWIDFDVAVTFPGRESMTAKEEAYSRYEEELAASLGELLVSFFFI